MRSTTSLIALLACTACSLYPDVIQDNYMSYEYLVNQRSDEEIHASAESICKERNKLAVRTIYTCVLPRCSATYQCMTEAEAKESGLLNAR